MSKQNIFSLINQSESEKVIFEHLYDGLPRFKVFTYLMLCRHTNTHTQHTHTHTDAHTLTQTYFLHNYAGAKQAIEKKSAF